MDNSSSVTKMDLLVYSADPDVARNKAWSSKTNSHDMQSNKANLLVFLPSPSSPSPAHAILPSNTRKDLREDQVAANLNFSREGRKQ